MLDRLVLGAIFGGGVRRYCWKWIISDMVGGISEHILNFGRFSDKVIRIISFQIIKDIGLTPYLPTLTIRGVVRR